MTLASRLLNLGRKLPEPVQRVVHACSAPGSPIFSLYLRANGHSAEQIPPPTPLVDGTKRVYIAPSNAAEQARLWAASLEMASPDIGATNMVAPVLTGGAFETDKPVPLGAFHLSKRWQRNEFERVTEFTHVLNESLRPMFGALFRYDPVREIQALIDRGISVAYLGHGSDTRNPALHRTRTPWSPFHDDLPYVARLQRLSDATRRQVLALGIPAFVSTPDLLEDLPGSYWCPLVVDVAPWREAARPLLSESRIRVTHIPSNNWFKGTELIAPTLEALQEVGTLDYFPLQQIAHNKMPTKLGEADIVLEQFRLGSYGATAVEAMAAGRVVIGHVIPAVREHVEHTTGLELPIVEATPDTLGATLSELIDSPDRLRELGDQGMAYATAVHGGQLSARLLRQHWIDLD